jgi:hypothetical protein
MPAKKGIAKMASTFLSLHYHIVASKPEAFKQLAGG